MSATQYTRLTYTIRMIYREIARMSLTGNVSPQQLALNLGYDAGGSLSSQLKFLEREGYITRNRVGKNNFIVISKPLPEEQ